MPKMTKILPDCFDTFFNAKDNKVGFDIVVIKIYFVVSLNIGRKIFIFKKAFFILVESHPVFGVLSGCL